MKNVATTQTVLSLVDSLQNELDMYVADHEELLDAYEKLLGENEQLKDKIAELLEKDKEQCN